MTAGEYGGRRQDGHYSPAHSAYPAPDDPPSAASPADEVARHHGAHTGSGYPEEAAGYPERSGVYRDAPRYGYRGEAATEGISPAGPTARHTDREALPRRGAAPPVRDGYADSGWYPSGGYGAGAPGQPRPNGHHAAGDGQSGDSDSGPGYRGDGYGGSGSAGEGFPGHGYRGDGYPAGSGRHGTVPVPDQRPAGYRQPGPLAPPDQSWGARRPYETPAAPAPATAAARRGTAAVPPHPATYGTGPVPPPRAGQAAAPTGWDAGGGGPAPRVSPDAVPMSPVPRPPPEYPAPAYAGGAAAGGRGARSGGGGATPGVRGELAESAPPRAGGSANDGPGTGGARPARGDADQPAAGRPKRRRLPLWQELPLLLVIAFCLAVLIRSFLMQAFFIPSGSMEDTLITGDRVLVNKVVYQMRDPARGEIVVFTGPDSWAPVPNADEGASMFARIGSTLGDLVGVSQPGENDFIKRVIGLPGDVVSCCDVEGRVIVNGQPIDEPYVIRDSPLTDAPEGTADCRSRQFPEVVVPAGEMFVMGDHRQRSQDSRCQGTVPIENVIGRAFVIVWPNNRWAGLSATEAFADVPQPAAAVAAPLADTQARTEPVTGESSTSAAVVLPVLLPLWSTAARGARRRPSIPGRPSARSRLFRRDPRLRLSA